MMNLVDSKISWIGDIPDSWNVTYNKYIMYKQKLLKAKYENDNILSLTQNGVIVKDPEDFSGKMPQSYDGYQIVKKGNLLMCLFDIDVTPRCVGIINNDGLTSPAYSQYILNKEDDVMYYYYYYLMLDNDKTLLHMAKNLRHSLSEIDFGMIPVIEPPYQEQVKIAKFLDRNIPNMVKIIDSINKQIEVLTELKKSEITKYVTKGIYDDIESKETGIQWIGKIPKHWDIFPIKQHLNVHSSERIFEDEYTYEGIPFFRTKEIVELANNKPISVELYISNERYNNLKSSRVRKDDILISSIGTIGEVWICDGRDFWYKDGNITQIDSNELFESKYIKYFLKSNAFMEAIKYYESTTTISALTIEKIKRIKIICPPKAEQKEICDKLDKLCENIDELIDKKTKQIEKINKYKQSMLYEYITGKKRIKEE